MKILDGNLKDVKLIQPKLFCDPRGYFFESFNYNIWKELGLPHQFVQDNQSFSYKGVLRGLHFQRGEFSQGKLVTVIHGKVLDVAVDMRVGSETFGHWEFYELNGQTGNMVYIPEGFAHGFLALEDSIFSYKCTAPYKKEAESGILWNDATLKIDWPVKDPLISEKDQILPNFSSFL
jgi:dTDP-4-dehydrorhamnose 3,5-epimerase